MTVTGRHCKLLEAVVRTGRRRRGGAFTLVELLIILAIVAVLSGLLLPAINLAKVRAQRFACLSNLRQLGFAWTMYSGDNAGELVGNYPILAPGVPNPESWFWGYAAMPHDAYYGPAPRFTATNTWVAQSAKLFPYHKSVEVSRCPADRRAYDGRPVVRSVSMNGWMNGRSFGDPTGVSTEMTPEADASLTYTLYRKESQLGRPSQLWVLIDEDERSINDSMFVVDMGAAYGIADAPARRHATAYGLSFADGHSEIFKLVDPRTINWKELPVAKENPLNKDWETLRKVSTEKRH